MTLHRVAGVDDVGEGCLLRVEVDGTALCLARLVGGGFAAINDTCTHEDESLSDGDLEGTQVQCPAHGSLFDLKTGEPSGFPAEISSSVYEVTVIGEDVLVDMP
jgi:3-phenylpropionate/trans-cinnamate dioxygenase ferredoxin component